MHFLWQCAMCNAHCDVGSFHANAKEISRQSIINGRMQEMNNNGKIVMLHVPCGICVSATKTINQCMQILMEGREVEKKLRPILEYNKLKPLLCSGINCRCICLSSSFMASASSASCKTFIYFFVRRKFKSFSTKQMFTYILVFFFL